MSRNMRYCLDNPKNSLPKRVLEKVYCIRVSERGIFDRDPGGIWQQFILGVVHVSHHDAQKCPNGVGEETCPGTQTAQEAEQVILVVVELYFVLV